MHFSTFSQTRHSSGIKSSFFSLDKYPKWWGHFFSFVSIEFLVEVDCFPFFDNPKIKKLMGIIYTT